jgi:HK97 family phage major capsid protein
VGLVEVAAAPTILLSSAGAISPLRSVCRIEQITTDVWHGVSSAGITTEWLAEATEAAEAAPSFAQPTITPAKGAAHVTASMEVAADSGIAAQLGYLFADARNTQEATALTLGTGSGQPHGVVDALLDASKTVASASADTFASADVYKLLESVPARWRPNMVVIAGLPLIHAMAKMETTAGARLFPEIADGKLLGRRLIEVTGMDEVINAGQENYVVAAFDPRSYVIVDRLGSTVVFDNLVRGANRRPTGEVSWTLFYRTGADLVVTDAGRLLNVT